MNLPTHFGKLDVSWTVTDDGAVVQLGGQAAPGMGFVLSLPASLTPTVTVDGAPVGRDPKGFWLTRQIRTARVQFNLHM